MKTTRKLILACADIIKDEAEEIFIEDNPYGNFDNGVNVYLDEERQSILGFGGAFTESSACVYANMCDEDKKKTVEWLFGDSGLRYNIGRLSIGSCDFTVDSYTYVEDGDTDLSTFSIARDEKYIIPFVKDAMAVNGDIMFIASSWTPPPYMKDNGQYERGGRLLDEYYPLFAKYICRFLEEYEKHGIHISYLTPQNELRFAASYESCLFTAEEEARFNIILSEEMEKRGLTTEILCWEHNRGGMLDFAKRVYKIADKQTAGAAYHWYHVGFYDEIRLHREKFPDKLLIQSEFCHGLIKRLYGYYREDMLLNLFYGSNAIVEWNLVLDAEGGPKHDRDIGCNAPVMLDDTGRAERKSVYSVDYMYAHNIQKGAKVLSTTCVRQDVLHLAVKNPDGKVLVYLFNKNQNHQEIDINFGKEHIKTTLTPYVLTMFEVEI
ncbi:MAG: hypothetical protein IKA74_01395 [Clostridia bacterium]|nr:hypothetical protein [Clostridia bacterium]